MKIIFLSNLRQALYHHDKEDAESLKIDLEVTPFAITVTWLKDGESINIINDHVFHTKNKAVIRVRQLLKGKGLLNRLRRRSFFSEVKVFHALHCINEWGWACQLNENPFPFNRFGYVVLIPKIRAYRLRLIPDTISIFDVFFSESFELGKIPGSIKSVIVNKENQRMVIEHLELDGETNQYELSWSDEERFRQLGIPEDRFGLDICNVFGSKVSSR